MKIQFKAVYQFRVDLKEIKPPVWRRIQVPDAYTFWDLHVAIQDAMGWTDTHLHHFEMTSPASGNREIIGIPDDDFPEMKTLAGWKKSISMYFSEDNNTARYEYDFGDGWVHSVKLEKILKRQTGVEYPLCTAGKRACPPEDSGGPFQYPDFLEAITNPSDDRHEELLEWVGGEFDPEEFGLDGVYFDDPAERLKAMLQGD